jgi:hypothetical protein
MPLQPGPVATPQAPWHMWGTSETVTVPHPSSSGAQYVQTVQVAKISYRRPETWRFLFGAHIIQAPDAGANPVHIYVDFDVWTGVGRSRILLSEYQRQTGWGFCHLDFQYATPGANQVGRTKWAMSVPSLPLDDSAPTVLQEISLIPGQDLQVQARVATLAVDAQDAPTVLEIHGYFAPNVHVRPDWIHPDDSRQFTGNETGGT